MSTPPAGGSPFEFPPEPGDRWRHALAGSERVMRGVVRWVRGHASAADLRRAATPAGPPPSAAADTTPAGPPIVYLPALSWSYRFQRPQQLARALAAAGRPVLYVDGFSRARWQPRRAIEPGGVARLRVAVAGRPDPFRSVLEPASADALAELLLAGLRAPPVAVVAQLPFWAPLAQRLRERLGVPLVYDRIDLHAGFAGVPAVVEAAERELIASADLVTASSVDLLPAAADREGPAALLPNAVAIEDFPLAPPLPASPVTVGYVGALAEWFDADAVVALATARPQWSLRLAGRVESPAVERLRRLANVVLVGEIPYAEVPTFVGSLHALLVPFRDLALTRAVDPVKLYEALACGRPVVMPPLRAIERWPEPLVYTYAPGALVGTVERALRDDETLARRRREAVAGETWAARATELLARIDHAPARAEPGASVSDRPRR